MLKKSFINIHFFFRRKRFSANFRYSLGTFGKLILLINLLIISELTIAQKRQRPEINLDQFIQKVFPVQQENLNYEDLYESLYQLYQNPLDLNNATREDLASLYLLSNIQINNFIEHRQQFGSLLSIYELQAVKEFDLETITRILPFVEVSQQYGVKSFIEGLRNATEHYLVMRADQVLEPAKGYQNDKFLGSPQRLYTRYRLAHPKDFRIGFTAEKDAGEPNYLDFFTAHLQIQNKGNLKNLVVGDYQVQIGQGLITSAGFVLGKGSETVATTRRSNLGIRPYGSLVESGFLRGAAATYRLSAVELTTFYSIKKTDATIDESTGEREDYFSSILSSGLHRTESEMARRNQILMQDLGVNALFKLKNGQIGATLLHTQFDGTMQKDDRMYNKFEFRGNKNMVAGGNFSYNFQNFNFFGEVARSSSGGIGAVGGFVAALSRQIEWAMNIRNYDRNFHSFYANAFGENTRNINERGIYWGLKYTPKKGITFSAFYDRYRFAWLKYLVDAPSAGFDYLLRFSYQPNKKFLFYTQYHEEHKGKNLPNNQSVTDVVVETNRQSLLGNMEYAINRTFKVQTRLQYNRFQYLSHSKSDGYAFMQDIEGSIKRLQLKGRIAYFSTDDYDSRIYAYENDVLYAISFPAYYGKGFRSYLIARYPLSRHLDCWVRLARTQLSNATTIGSGNDQLSTPHKTDLKLQVRWRF